MDIEKYRGLIDPKTRTMSSKDLHKFVYETTGNFKELKTFHRKVKSTLFGTETPSKTEISDGTKMEPSLDSRGYVKYFNLTEVECNMVMATIDIKHLALMAEVFVKVKNDGYFIRDNLNPQQETKLVKEVKTKYDRRFIDLEREQMIEFIKEYLIKEGLSARQASSLLSDVYQACHIAVSQKLASQIVFEHYKNGMDANSLETINTLRKVAKVYNTDFTSAINFYNESMLQKFGEYYSMILAKAKATITNHNRKPSVALVKEAMIIESKSIIRLFSGLDNGTKLKGVGRKKLNEAVKAYYDEGFIISLEEKEKTVESILRGETRAVMI